MDDGKERINFLYRKHNTQEKEFNAKNMKGSERSYKSLRILAFILVIIVSIAAIMPFPSQSELKSNKPCVVIEANSVQQQQSQEEKIWDQLECSFGLNKQQVKLFILGIINLDELTMWVLGVDRRVVVLKMMHEKRMIQASDIADSTDRSLQNISYAMRELEEHGLVQSLTPGKKTWKKFILTEKGTDVFENLKKNNLISK
ncbi:Winged helix DNA-binding domain protein [uncultured archaeon]|nr:Winged helix DNA-binding domain protein [uncultured archaeon]